MHNQRNQLADYATPHIVKYVKPRLSQYQLFLIKPHLQLHQKTNQQLQKSPSMHARQAPQQQRNLTKQDLYRDLAL